MSDNIPPGRDPLLGLGDGRRDRPSVSAWDIRDDEEQDDEDRREVRADIKDDRDEEGREYMLSERGRTVHIGETPRGRRRNRLPKRTATELSLPPEEIARRAKVITTIYMVAIIFWIFLMLSLGLVKTQNMSILHVFIFVIPLAIFVFGIMNSKVITVEVEDELFTADYLPFGLIIVIPLLTWISKDYKGDKRMFINTVIVAIILSMISVLDIWVAPKNLFAVKHSKSALQTMSIALIVFAMFSYYKNYPDAVLTT